MKDARPFVIAKNPDATSRLPYLLRLPLADGTEVVLATRDVWPVAKDLFCYELPAWPEGADVVAEVAVERCWRRGKAVHLVLGRRVRRRSLFVWTEKDKRTVIFWKSATSLRSGRPGVRLPGTRSRKAALTVCVDSQERYGWRFARHPVRREVRQLPVGDYACLVDERVFAAVERKSVEDLATGLVSGGLALQLMELSQLPHAALVVEGRLRDLWRAEERGGVRRGWLLNVLTALQVAHPKVVWMFADTRSLAEDYAFRFLSAACRTETAPQGELGPALQDRSARRSAIVAAARQGRSWTVQEVANTWAVGLGSARADLAALVAQGLLSARRVGRRLVYEAVAGDGASPG
jgi:hypothetical protein